MAARSGSTPLLAPWTHLLIDMAAVYASSQEVVARRFWMLGTQSQRRPRASMREIGRMGSEKVQATCASASAMTFAAMAAGMKFLTSLALPQTARRSARSATDLAQASATIMRSGIRPVKKRVRANAARLRRKSR